MVGGGTLVKKGPANYLYINFSNHLYNSLKRGGGGGAGVNVVRTLPFKRGYLCDFFFFLKLFLFLQYCKKNGHLGEGVNTLKEV